MKTLPPANIMSESELSREVLRIAHVERWLAHNMRNAGRTRFVVKGDTGFPDWILLRPPRLIVAELKDETAKPYANQEIWLAAFRGCLEIEVYLWRPSDLHSGKIAEVLA